MAKMFPDKIPENINSSGEKLVYDLLKSEPNTDDWIVLHSLLIGNHIKNRWGEIDFIILAPKLGIFIIEVKSGRVERNKGIWRYIDRYGHISEDPRGPFAQAREAMYSLKNYLIKRYGKGSSIDNLLMNYAVFFPHVDQIPNGVEIEKYQLLINLKGAANGEILNFINKLSHQTLLNLSTKFSINQGDLLPEKKQVEEIFSFLRPDFISEISESTKSRMLENRIKELTEKQYYALDLMRDNPQCLFTGAAGTGKTFLALEAFHRSFESGESCLLLCSSNNLGQWLGNQCKYINSRPGYFVGSLNSFINAHSLSENDNDKYLDNLLDKITSGKIKQYSRLVLDEAQDIISDKFSMDILDFLIDGGWKNGQWNIFGDLEQQAIFTELSPSEILNSFNTYVNQYSRARLDINCRNTKRIGEYVSLASGFIEPPFKYSEVEGEPPVVETYDNNSEREDKLILILKKLLKNKVPITEITILTEFPDLCKVIIEKQIKLKIQLLSFQGIDFCNRTGVTISTIKNFKGLENNYVIIMDLDVPDNPRIQKLFYTSLSRAKIKLFLILLSSVFETVNKIFIQHISSSFSEE
jgi:hypothetical protein